MRRYISLLLFIGLALGQSYVDPLEAARLAKSAAEKAQAEADAATEAAISAAAEKAAAQARSDAKQAREDEKARKLAETKAAEEEARRKIAQKLGLDYEKAIVLKTAVIYLRNGERIDGDIVEIVAAGKYIVVQTERENRKRIRYRDINYILHNNNGLADYLQEAGKTEEPVVDQSSARITSRKNIESVIPVKRIPDGWVFRDELLAPWESNLPAVLSIIPDTTVEVVYHDDNRTTKEGFILPIKRSSVEFQYTSRLTHEQIRLEFVNVDFIYSTTNNNDVHYILEGITKKVKLKDTGFPQLTATDIIKHKILMEYGTPREFDGVWHIYEDKKSTYKVCELDERNIKVEMMSLKVKDKLEKAIGDIYSKQGIEYKKRLMVQGIDI